MLTFPCAEQVIFQQFFHVLCIGYVPAKGGGGAPPWTPFPPCKACPQYPCHLPLGWPCGGRYELGQLWRWFSIRQLKEYLESDRDLDLFVDLNERSAAAGVDGVPHFDVEGYAFPRTIPRAKQCVLMACLPQQRRQQNEGVRACCRPNVRGRFVKCICSLLCVAVCSMDCRVA